MRPRPQRGLGWRKGGDKFPKNRFSTEAIFSDFHPSGVNILFMPVSHENRFIPESMMGVDTPIPLF
jgi:hypothetical protein